MANLRANKITSTEVFETTGSVQFDGVNDGLTISDNSDFDLGTGDFTIEGWYYIENVGVYLSLFDWRGSGGDGNYPALLRNNTDNYIYYYVNSTVKITNVNIDYNTWFHVTVCRSSGITRLFLNGNEKGSFVDNTNYVSRDILLGLSQSDSNDFKGHISNYRVIKGTALYTKNFTPPTRELTVIPNTVLLACQSTTNTAQEATGKTITVNGNAVANELTPGLLTDRVKSGGSSAITGSVEFTRNGENTSGSPYLSITGDSETYNFGSGDFTVECWIKLSQSGIEVSILGGLGPTNGSFVFSISNDNTLRVGSAIVAWRHISSVVNFETSWHHVSCSKKSGTMHLFIDGILVKQAADSFEYNLIPSGNTSFAIGARQSNSNAFGPGFYFNGFISNLRIVKGTALYTSDFIPPTRELKNIPGTVLLCCKDSSNPTAEETGKTITGYGDLQRADGVELIANGHFSSNTDNWTAVGNASLSTSSGQIVLTGDGSTAGGGAAQGFATIVGKKYVLKYEAFSGTISAGQIRIGTSANSFSITFDNSVSASAHDDITFVATSTTTYVTLGLNAGLATSGTFKYDNISVTLVDGSNKGSNFTPQVGSDGSVEFAGPTKINSENYFYLPTGNTESRGRGRGVFGGGADTAPSLTNILDFVNIQSSGVSQDFGDLSIVIQDIQGCSSLTRGIFAGGQNPGGNTSNVEYITISTQGNAIDFGADLTNDNFQGSMCSSSTRGLYGGGTTPTVLSQIDYITIASTGLVNTFGNLTESRFALTSFSSPIRGIFAGGATPTVLNTIDYVTIASTGNAQNFGDISDQTRRNSMGTSSQTRGLIASGYNPSATTAVHYITISSTGNSQDFGDLNSANYRGSGTSNSIRGLFAGGYIIPSTGTNRIDYVTIASTGNASDFGDLYVARHRLGTSVSDSHGGLG